MPDCPNCSNGLEKNGFARFLLLQVGPFVLESCREWTARINPKQLEHLDIGYIVDNVDPPYKGEKCMVFLMILAVARMAIWTM